MSEISGFDIIKLVVETLTPIIILIFGIKINKIYKRQENTIWTNQKILEKRLEIYDKIIVKLNDIYCFHFFVGNWKEISPNKIIEHKRYLDKILNSYKPLFTDKLFDSYNEFMNTCYTTFTGWGNDAKIKSSYLGREKHSNFWEKEWVNKFDCGDIKTNVDEERLNDIKKDKYQQLMDAFKDNLEIFQAISYKTSATSPNKR